MMSMRENFVGHHWQVRRHTSDVTRITIAAVFATTVTIAVSAQEFLAGSGLPGRRLSKTESPGREHRQQSGTTKRSGTMLASQPSSCNPRGHYTIRQRSRVLELAGRLTRIASKDRDILIRCECVRAILCTFAQVDALEAIE